MKEAKYFLGKCGVRYWEDATINGATDDDGTLVPGRVGDNWVVLIDLASGKVVDWPEGTTADIHYKVCDAGEYFLLDGEQNAIGTREGYVPSDFLCHGDDGYGDYVIMKIDGDGQIAEYSAPEIVRDEWTPIGSAA